MTLATDIAAVPPGGTWNGTGETYQTAGVVVTKPIHIVGNGSTFYNPATTGTVGAGLQPFIQIKDTTDVTVESLTLQGNTPAAAGREDRWDVGEAGIDILSSAHVTLLDIRVRNVFGDGLTLGFQPRKPPSSDLTVDGYTIDGAGGIRQAITLAYVDGATLNNVTVVREGAGGIDFQSDLHNVGSGNVTINNFAGVDGIQFEGFLSGPVTINNPRYTGNLTMLDDAANSNQTVTVNGGHIYIKRNYYGTPPAGIWIRRDEVQFPGPGASTLTMKNVAVDRRPGTLPITTGAWSVTGGGKLVLDGCCIDPPLGSADAASSVVITP